MVVRAMLVPPPIISPRRPLCSPIRRNRWINICHAHHPDLVHEPLILAVLRILGDHHRWDDVLSRFVVVAHFLFFRLALAPARVGGQVHVQKRGDGSVGSRASYFGAA